MLRRFSGLFQRPSRRRNASSPADTNDTPEFAPLNVAKKIQKTRRQRVQPGQIQKLDFGQGSSENGTLVALIITISDGASYDALFSSIPQKVGEGERAATYAARQVEADALRQLLEFGEQAPICQVQPDAMKLVSDLAQVEPDSVVFNWECCSGCGEDDLHGQSTETMALMALLLSRGFCVMVSDFSLGALIKQWDSELLGANPFVKVAEFDHGMTLRFESDALRQCDDSAQLQVLGELCTEGVAHVHAMSGTKAYGVDSSKRPVRVLTIVTECGGRSADEVVGQQRHLLSEVQPAGKGQEPIKGLAGHCIVEFPNGEGRPVGRLLTACPHWFELSRLDAAEETVLQVAEERYGQAYASELRNEFESMGTDTASRSAHARSSACRFVQQSSAAKHVPKSRSSSTGSSLKRM